MNERLDAVLSLRSESGVLHLPYIIIIIIIIEMFRVLYILQASYLGQGMDYQPILQIRRLS